MTMMSMTKTTMMMMMIIPLFTLGSIYSTNVSRAEQMPETNNSH